MSNSTTLRNNEGIENYTKYWKSDLGKDSFEDQSKRLDQYT